MTRNVCFVALATLFFSASALKVQSPTPTLNDVSVERAKLEKMSVMLGHLLQSNVLLHSKIAPALKLFSSNLDSVLEKSKSMKPSEAMKALMGAKAGVSGLVADMTKTQTNLMKENVQQQESLLMGVLMTHQKDSMSQQLEILKSADFEGLDVAKALLSSADAKTPLYLQAARFLDTHKNASGVFSTHSSAVNRTEAMAASLDKRVASLEREAKTKDIGYKNKIDGLEKLVNKGGNRTRVLKALIKREERNHKKWAAMQMHDIASMKAAAAAVRSGDVVALNRARAALQASLDSLKNKNAGMVVFLQKGHSILQRDCPYCAAQCVEKCHNDGKPYVACLSDCADAGKS
eukprot:TRINITY_DN62896_c0_g1_i1.p1 TRINITY_DN62896_c0_g1~~TRINITY_DN62896_c0_g1_i1.p1  ORF type:complete len:348 (+),score=87.24 TRINITY_DN62896_c0_g1_i1:68-1111(+)